MAFPPVPFQEWFLRQTSTGNAALNAYVARVKADGGVVEAIGCVPLAVWDWVAPVAPSFVGLLDLYPNAAAAYSLRKLRAAYSGSAVRVRKEVSLVSQETDIGFDANGDLDTSTLLSFASDADNGDVFVSIWYDQSGNVNRDATQSLATNQPKIVSAGSLIELNSKTAIKGDGANDILSLSTGLNLSSGYSIFQVVQVPSANSYGITISSSDTSNYSRIQIFNGLYRFSAAATNYDNYGTPGNKGAQYLWSSVVDGSGNLDTNRNGSAYGSTKTSVTGTFEFDIIGTNLGVNSFEYFQELIVFNSDQSSNRTGIETNINDYFSIYP